jgi:molybdate transport system ATP-binding protein
VADRALTVIAEQAGPVPLNVAFTCEPGQVLALFGPSGSGKTTILRSIAGLYTPRQAQVSIAGDTWLDTNTGINLPPHHRRVGFVFQEYALFPHLSVLGNVTIALSHHPRTERRGRAMALLRLVHLEHLADRRPAALSGGERQRVAVARALAREPRVLLLDEPFAAVDRGLRQTLQGEIDAIRRAFDIPIVLVTHDFEDVMRLATHLVLLRAGQVVANGSMESLTSRADLPWLRETVGLGTVLDAEVVHVEPSRGLARLDISGTVLVAPNANLSAGERVRVRIPARDVILASEAPHGLSVHNVLGGIVTRVERGGLAEVAVVQLAVGQIHVLAEITTDAVERMRIAEGVRLHALIKSVSLEVLPTGPMAAAALPGRARQ